MRLAKSLTILFVCIYLCSVQSATAQAPPPLHEAEDRPTQRWLPLPQGDVIELSEQAQLLQQLRDLISSESGTEAGTGDSPLPKLSEQQLREMEKALESMREQIGEDKLPNLESIPKEWIDQALSDPILRKQAQQLLEQYARDRKLPLTPQRTPLNSDGVPYPRRQPSDKSGQNLDSNPKRTPNSSTRSKSPRQSLPGKESNDRASNDPASNDPASSDPASSDPIPNVPTPRNEAPNGQALGSKKPTESIQEQPLTPNGLRGDKSSSDEFGQSPERPIPARPDAERIEALQELFKKLKTIEGQRQSEKNVPKKNFGSASSRSPSQSNSNSSTNNRATTPKPPSSQSNPAMPPRSSRSGSKPAPALSDESPKQGSPTLTAAESPNGATGNDPSLDPPLLPPESANSNSANLNSASSDLDKPAQSKSKALEPLRQSGPASRKPDSQSTDMRANGNRPNSPDRTPSAGPVASKDNNQSRAKSSGSPAPDVDIKTQLERHGLGRALQSIVEKTMKEQGESNSANSQTTNKSASAPSKSKDNRTASKAVPPAVPSVSPSQKSTASVPTFRNSDGNSKSNGTGATPSVPPSSNNPNTSSTMSGIRDMADQFWGAIRSTPGENSGSSSASAPNNAAGLGEFEFAWSGRVWLLLGLALIGIAMLILLARKRIVLATAAKEAEAELANEILNEGIRTRADVVRAFHRFVLRRAQPVANWWNHRYVALRLTEASPQLRSVIWDLASVYEHARYLPPDVTLSSEEIDRVQAALKQCVEGSV